MIDWLKNFLLPVACVLAIELVYVFVAAFVARSRQTVAPAPAVTDSDGAATLRRPSAFCRFILALGISWLAVFAAFGLYNIIAADTVIGIAQVIGAVALFAYMLVLFLSLRSQRLELGARKLVLRGMLRKRECALDGVHYYCLSGGSLRLFDEFGVPEFSVSQNWTGIELVVDALKERGFAVVGPKGPEWVSKTTPQYKAYAKRRKIGYCANTAWALFAIVAVFMIVICICMPSSVISTDSVTGRISSCEDYKITLDGDDNTYVINSLARQYLDTAFLRTVREGDEVALEFYVVLGGRHDVAQIIYDGRVCLKSEDVIAAELAEHDSMVRGAIISACISAAFLVVAVVCTVLRRKPRAAQGWA